MSTLPGESFAELSSVPTNSVPIFSRLRSYFSATSALLPYPGSTRSNADSADDVETVCSGTSVYMMADPEKFDYGAVVSRNYSIPASTVPLTMSSVFESTRISASSGSFRNEDLEKMNAVSGWAPKPHAVPSFSSVVSLKPRRRIQRAPQPVVLCRAALKQSVQYFAAHYERVHTTGACKKNLAIWVPPLNAPMYSVTVCSLRACQATTASVNPQKIVPTEFVPPIAFHEVSKLRSFGAMTPHAQPVGRTTAPGQGDAKTISEVESLSITSKAHSQVQEVPILSKVSKENLKEASEACASSISQDTISHVESKPSKAKPVKQLNESLLNEGAIERAMLSALDLPKAERDRLLQELAELCDHVINRLNEDEEDNDFSIISV
ncbi:hypothetical protein L596_026576 [Steinernema carpocapsae]|uniref:Uncharacterized protein n=1 Tax=Steinernema carpocapsae TaxID=34508 RepID=A0A4U5M1S7_STECR|nr:hypothetical protein L596_026576 [Steinernema carpocapsae]